jgi:hypothetical protein
LRCNNQDLGAALDAQTVGSETLFLKEDRHMLIFNIWQNLGNEPLELFRSKREREPYAGECALAQLKAFRGPNSSSAVDVALDVPAHVLDVRRIVMLAKPNSHVDAFIKPSELPDAKA